MTASTETTTTTTTQATPGRALRFVPGAFLLDNGPDELHVLLGNHSVTFLNAEVVRVVRGYAEVLRDPYTADDAVALLERRTDASAQVCRYVWDMLERSGCLCPGGSDTTTDELSDYWSSRGMDPAAITERLIEAPAVLAAAPSVLDELTASVRDAGVRVAAAIPVGGDGGWRADLDRALRDGPAVLAAWGVPYVSGVARTLGDAALEHRTTALFGGCSGAISRIGPCVLPWATACVECTNLRLLAHAGTAEGRVVRALRDAAPDELPPSAPAHPAFARAALSLFTIELSRVCLRMSPQTVGAVLELDADTLLPRRRVVHRAPFCSACHAPRPQPFGWDATFTGPVLSAEER